MLSQIESRWRDILLSPYPGDRAAAEDGIRLTYRAAGCAEPHEFLWFENPRDAGLASRLLATSPPPETPAEPLKRTRIGEVREKLMAGIGVDRWGAVRPWIGPCITERLSQCRWSIFDGQAAMKAPEVEAMKKRLYQLTLTWTGLSDSIICQAIGVDGGPADLYDCMVPLQRGMTICDLAAFDYMIESGAAPAGHPFRGLIDAARNCFNWWAYEGAALICARHISSVRDAEGRWHNTTGPAIGFPDGWGVYAIEGRAVPPRWIQEPAAVTVDDVHGQPEALRQAGIALYGADRFERDLRGLRGCVRLDSPLLREVLPSDPAARIERFRSYSPSLPLYERYMAGEREAVWRELQAIGPRVRQDPYAADALAVATETMARVVSNARLIIGRLVALGFEFETEGGSLDEAQLSLQEVMRAAATQLPADCPAPILEAIERMRAEAGPKLMEQLQEVTALPRNYEIRALGAPPGDIGGQIGEVEDKFGPLPISLRTFYEVAGDLSLRGNHRSFTEYGGVIGDPLVVDPLRPSWISEPGRLELSEDACSKAHYSGGAGYNIVLPAPSMDARLWNEPHDLLFVDYLRLAFRWGGFPGWEGKPALPKEVEILRAGLVEF